MSKPIAYDGALTISMPVSDLGRAIDWYQRVLGFEVDYRMDELGWCELKSPVAKVNIGLSVVETPNPGSVTPTFGVADIKHAKSTLEAANVRIDGDVITIENMVHLLTFYDVDDNTLMFSQMVAQGD